MIQADDYYPFGMVASSLKSEVGGMKNDYLYNEKELQEELGLEWYYYDTRFYDPAIARFGTIDLLASDYSFQSPYVYASNNPVLYVDVLGMGKGFWENAWQAAKDWGNAIADDFILLGKNMNEILQNNKSSETADFSTDPSVEFDGGEFFVIEDKSADIHTEGTGVKGKPSEVNEVSDLLKRPSGSDPKNVYHQAKNLVKLLLHGEKAAGNISSNNSASSSVDTTYNSKGNYQLIVDDENDSTTRLDQLPEGFVPTGYKIGNNDWRTF